MQYYTWILGACFSYLIICSVLCFTASSFRLLPWNCHLLPFLMQEVVLFNLRHLTSLSPLPVGAQMAAKGMLERFHSYLGDDKPGFRRERQDCLCSLNRSHVPDKHGRDVMLPVIASAVVWGPTCSPILYCLIIMPRAPFLSRSVSWFLMLLTELAHVMLNQSLLSFVRFWFSLFLPPPPQNSKCHDCLLKGDFCIWWPFWNCEKMGEETTGSIFKTGKGLPYRPERHLDVLDRVEAVKEALDERRLKSCWACLHHVPAGSTLFHSAGYPAATPELVLEKLE